ncbi:MAG TPA: CooT family nickel-binding protein [Malonomonas sp.]
MCLDYGPFKLVKEEEETDLDNVATILIQGDGLKLIDAFGKTSLFAGRISEIDLMNQRIVLA